MGNPHIPSMLVSDEAIEKAAKASAERACALDPVNAVAWEDMDEPRKRFLMEMMRAGLESYVHSTLPPAGQA